ncbi:transcription factor TFIIIB component B'' homolog [Brachionichthys hirsutus]|uniref:transcription factor TFIIIB component B'' homolog n=1 Tax=Brachionichthys hirsutus TaxID=412623 RepID=UPI003605196D
MFRRSRFSVRPNVGTAGRSAAAAPQEAPPVNQEPGETPKEVSESSTENKPVTPPEQTRAAGDGNDPNGESTSAAAAVQRRKRFSVKPKVVPGRLSAGPRAPKSPVNTVSKIPVEVAGSDLRDATTTNQTPHGFRSPRRRRPSEDGRQPKIKVQSTPVVSEGLGAPAASPPEDLLTQPQTHLRSTDGDQMENTPASPVEEVPFRLPDKVPSLPGKEAMAISEKAKTLVSSKSRLSSTSPASSSLSRLLNDPSDLQRLAKARKLRELIREAMHKEKKVKKAKQQPKEFNLDPAKMTMRDLIHYLPLSNPMTSSLEEAALENETVVPPSPRDRPPETVQKPEPPLKMASPREEEEEEEEAAAAAEEEQEDGLMVPQVKVAEDGTLIIDEESLTVEVQRAKGPNPADDRDPIFERGSTTMYSSFRKTNYAKPWSSEETDMFFLAVSMVGTDFSMICQLFPHRTRSEIKNKFKKEERINSWRIDKAFRERRKLDIEYFSKLLEKILEVQKNRKKLKSLSDKNSEGTRKRKTKGKKPARKNEMADLAEEEEEEEEEGEKENEDLCNEEESPASKPNKKRKRKVKEDGNEMNDEPNDKKNKVGQKSSQQDEACIPEDAEAALPEDRENPDMSEDTETMNAAKKAAIKPAKLSRGQKALLPLGKKRGNKKPSMPPSESDREGDKASDGASTEQVKDASPVRQGSDRKSASDASSEDEDATVQPPKPTRYGRMPKPTKPLSYPAKEDTRAPVPETAHAPDAQPKRKCAAKRTGSSKTQSESKKPKLVTLRASQSENSDEEEERAEEPAYSSGRDGAASAFVPASLRSPRPVISELEETMEELDILVNMPDVSGVSHDALCPEGSCTLAQNETGAAEPCEHRTELLVDLLDFVSSENAEVFDDDRNNEAAQTLLTMGTLAEFSPSATQESSAGKISERVDETSRRLDEGVASKSDTREENAVTPFTSAASGQGDAGPLETAAAVEQQNGSAAGGPLTTEPDGQGAGSDTSLTPQGHTSPERSEKSSQPGRGRFIKVKPRPNLSRAPRTRQSRSQTETSAGRTGEESPGFSDAILQPGVDQATGGSMEETQTCNPAATESMRPNADSACVQQSADHPGHRLPPVGDSPVGKEDESNRTPHQGKKGRFQNVKPNLAQPPRGLYPKHQTTGDANTNPNLQLTKKIIGNTEEDPARPTRMAFDVVSTLTPTEKLSATQEQKSDVGVVAQVESRGTASDQRTSETQNVSEAQQEPSGEHAQGNARTTADSTEETLAPCLGASGLEELPISLTSTWRFRSQKVKPKPNVSQTSRSLRSGPQTSNNDPTPNPESRDETLVDVEGEPACIASPERFGHPESGTVSDPSGPERQDFCEAQFDPSREHANRDTGPTSESTKEELIGIPESSFIHRLSSDSTVPRTQVGPGSNRDAVPVQGPSDLSVHCVPHMEEVPAKQKEETVVPSTSHVRRSQKIKPKPNLPQTSRIAHSRPRNTKNTLEKNSDPTQNPEYNERTTVDRKAEQTRIASPEDDTDLAPSSAVVSTLNATEEPSTTAERKTPPSEPGAATPDQSRPDFQNVSGAHLDSNGERVTRDARPTSETTEERLSHSNTQPGEKPSGSTSRPESTDDSVADSEALSASGKPGPDSSSDSASVLVPSLEPTEELASTGGQKMGVGRAPESKAEGSGRKVPQRRRCFSKAKPNLASATRNTRATPSNPPEPCCRDVSSDETSEGQTGRFASTQRSLSAELLSSTPAGGRSSGGVGIATAMPTPPSIAEHQSVLTVSIENEGKERRPVVKESAGNQVDAGPASRRDQRQMSVGATETNPQPPDGPATVSVAERGQEVSIRSSKSSCKTPPIRRGRLLKPKPNLGRSSQPKQVQSDKQEVAVSHKLASEAQPKFQEPVEGAADQNSTLNEAGSPPGCSTQLFGNSMQHGPISGIGGIQAPPCSDVLLDQAPSDPEEPFFILSLTEIPAVALEEGEGEVEEEEEEGFPDFFLHLPAENSEDPNEPGSAEVQPMRVPGSVQKVDGTEDPPTKRGVKTQRWKRTGEILSAAEVEPIPSQESELPGPSARVEVSDQAVADPQETAVDHVDCGTQSPQAKTPSGQKGKPTSPPSRASSRTPSTPTQPTPQPPAEQGSERGPLLFSDQSLCTVECLASSSVEEEPISMSQYFLSDIFTEVDEG